MRLFSLDIFESPILHLILNRDFRCLFLALLVGLIWGASTPLAEAEDCLTFSVVDRKYKSHTVINNFSDALEKGGICNKFQFMPERRATMTLLDGEVDGEILRTPAYGDTVSAVAVMINPPILTLTRVILSKNGTIKNLEALGKRRLGILGGEVWAENVGQTHTNTIRAKTNAQLYELLEQNRVDAILTEGLIWQRRRMDHPDFSPNVIGTLSVHVWLRKDRIQWAPLIAAAMQNYLDEHKSFFPGIETN